MVWAGLIHPPDRSVERAGIDHPDQVGDQEHCRLPVYDGKGELDQNDGSRQEYNLQKSPSRKLESEKEDGPQKIQDQMDAQEPKRPPHPARLTPYRPGADRHQEIENRPDRSEKPGGRSPERLRELSFTRCTPNALSPNENERGN